MDLQNLTAILKNNGVVGAGGAGFPTYAKLNNKADTVILNCAECEPLLKLHQQLLTEHTVEILSALKIIAKAMNAENIIVCVKAEYTDTVNAVKEYMDGITLKELSSVYPTGDEVVLIYEATKRVVRPGGLPIEVGVVVFNVETIYNAYLAITDDIPVIDKLVTITCEVNNPITVRVPIGTSVSKLVEMAGGSKINDPAYLIGGPMMGTIGTKEQAVTKTTNAVLVLPKDHQLIRDRNLNPEIGIKRVASSCCQCQSCTDLCPRHALGHPIQPHLFMRALASNDLRNSEMLIDTMFCSGCGICEQYACPQSLMPRTLIAQYKMAMRNAGVRVPNDRESSEVSPQREFRSVPEKRLETRIGLGTYHAKSLLDDKVRKVTKVVISLNQHIGVPSVPIVEIGQEVDRGELIAKSADGALSVPVHSSITGKVIEITNKFIIIKAN